MIQLSSISKTYDGRPVIQGLNLHLEPGQTTALIGPSGCGKSTLIRIMLGLIEPDAGEISFNGTQLSQDNADAIRQKVGYVIQEGGLFPHLTAQENLCLLANYLRWPKQKQTQRIEDLCQLCHFPNHLLTQYPNELSGGQRQRVALMRALMLDPEVLLFDEPLGALDPMIRANLQNELADIFSKLKKTVVIVTHDIGEAGFFADKIVLLQGGKIVQQGSLAELVKEPKDPFVTEFINAQRSPLESVH